MMPYRGTIGCAVLPCCAQPLTGRVVQRFSSCVHLQMQDLLVTLGDNSLPSHPYTIRLANFPEGISEGAGCRVDNWQLILDGSNNIDLRALEQYWPRQQVAHPVSQDQIREGLVLSRACLAAAGRPDGLAGLLIEYEKPNCFVAVARPWVETLENAIRSRNWQQLTPVAERLAGLGPGLTPAGDDVLCGLLAALRFHRESCGDGPRQELLDDLAQTISAKTTTFCAQMIKAAAKGMVSEDLANWLTALYRGELSILENLTKRLLAFGHSSGSDLLCGLVIALESITEGTS